MLAKDPPVVVAVCGSPGAGKTTIASATAARLGLPFLSRDEFKTGLGLSSAFVAEDGGVRLEREFHVAGGPFSLRAQSVLVDAARLLAMRGVSFVVEAVLSRELVEALLRCGARLLAVHVVAEEAVIGRRLRARATEGGAIDQQLLSQFERGQMARSIFEPPDEVETIIEIDTSDDGDPNIGIILAAVVALLESREALGGSSLASPPLVNDGPRAAGGWRPGQSVESLRSSPIPR